MVAAWLHDIGQFLSINEHHKHSLYIINALPIVGLTPAQKRIVANLARYHHKSFPKLRHEPFAALSREDRNRVRKLSAILRLADAADFEHVGRSAGLKACMARGELTIRLDGGGGASLAKWAVERHARLFEEVFRMKVRVQ
jgi:exopolyphosphatase/guanosine-5'-triphosphate,3'-diphosphate pyrophosphatase